MESADSGEIIICSKGLTVKNLQIHIDDLLTPQMNALEFRISIELIKHINIFRMKDRDSYVSES